jgi:hypothetical protein
LNDLYNKIKTAKPLQPPESDEGIVEEQSGKVQNGKTMGKEPKFDAQSPKDVEGNATESLMGHEKETLGNVPKTKTDSPDVPEGGKDGSLMGHEKDGNLSPEFQTRENGTVIHSQTKNNNKQVSSNKDAFRVAARMLESGIIVASELEGKVKELSSYKSEQIQDLEKAMFASGPKKGFKSASNGLEKAVVIPSEMVTAGKTLEDKLKGMFKLTQQNNEAENNELFRTKQLFNK